MDLYKKIKIKLYSTKVKLKLLFPKWIFKIKLNTINFNLNEINDTFLIYMLCGKNTVLEAIATYYSFQKYYNKYVQVLILDDGTLTEKDITKLLNDIKFIKVIRKTEADLKFNELLNSNPELVVLRNIRDNLIFGPRLIDIHLFANNFRILQLDTDVLFLNKPYFLMDVLLSTGKKYYFNLDIKNSYSGSIDEIKASTNINILDRFNGGLSVFEADFSALKFYADMINKKVPNYDFYYWEQTLFSLMMSDKNAKPLPDEYDVHYRFKNYNDLNVPCRHYCGDSRVNYYKDYFLKVQTSL